MKTLSPHTRALIKELQEQRLREEGLFGINRINKQAAARAKELIEQIAQAKEWVAICSLYGFMVAPDKTVAAAAVKAIAELLPLMRASMLFQLDDRLRGGHWNVPIYSTHWDIMQPASIEKTEPEKCTATFMGPAASHRNGYIREAAVRQLAKIRDGSELPYLLIRLADWVPQVRAAGESAIESRTTAEYLPHYISCLALMDRVKGVQRGRREHKRVNLIQAIAWMLQQKENRPLLIAGLKHKDFDVRRAALKLLSDPAEDDLESIIKLILADRDVATRKSVPELAKTLPPDKEQEIFKSLLADRDPSLRRAALIGICRLNEQHARQYLTPAIMDRAATVRDYSRWHLARIDSGFDFRDFYKKQLADAATVQALESAIGGLGETGKVEDTEVIAAQLNHASISVQRAAIKALARLDAPAHVEIFMSRLKSAGPGVSGAGRNALLPMAATMDGAEIWRALNETSLPHVRWNCLRLINRLPKWERISYLLQALTLDDQAVCELALAGVDAWTSFYRATWTMTMPSAEQEKRFISTLAIARKKVKFPQYARQVLEHCLSVFEGTKA